MSRVFIREKALKDGRASLILDYYEFGQRTKETLGIYVFPKDKNSRNPFLREAYNEAMAKANKVKNRTELRLIEATHNIATPQYDYNACFITYFGSLVEKKNCSWRNTYCQLLKFTKGKLAFGHINEEFLGRFQSYLLTKLHVNSAAQYMNILSTCLNTAVRQRKIPSNPYKFHDKIKMVEPKLNYLSKDQVKELNAKNEDIPQWVQDVFFFGCYTGLRLSDLKGLKWDDITYAKSSEGQLLGVIQKVQKKTGGIVSIPISPQAQEILSRQCPERSNVFIMRGRTTVKYHIDKWRKRVGFHFTFHSSRHTFGTMLQAAGSDINTTSKLMGHRNLNQTLRYAKVVDSVKIDAISKMSKMFSL
jgi:integrase